MEPTKEKQNDAETLFYNRQAFKRFNSLIFICLLENYILFKILRLLLSFILFSCFNFHILRLRLQLSILELSFWLLERRLHFYLLQH